MQAATGSLESPATVAAPRFADPDCRTGRLRPGARVLLGAFGAGFTWGGAVVEWEIPG